MIPSDKTMNELARLNEQAMTPTPTKKEWCGHMMYMRDYDWWIFIGETAVTILPDDATSCPRCGKERPKG